MEAFVFVGSVSNSKIRFAKLSHFNRSDFKQERFAKKTSLPKQLNGFRLINTQLLRIFNQLFESTLIKTDVEIENVLFVVPVKPQVSLL
mgnify:CR=1 FL=1